jgi:hypothetical protein
MDTRYSLNAGCGIRYPTAPATYGLDDWANYAHATVKLGQQSGVQYTGLALFSCPCNRFATISSASLTLDLSGGTLGSSFFQIAVFAIAADNQGWPSDGSQVALDFSHRLTTGAGPVSAVSGAHAYDVTAALQEVVDRVGYAPGNFVMFYIGWSATGDWANIATKGIDTPNGPPVLQVTWSGGDSGGSGGGGGGGGQSGVNASFLVGMMSQDEGLL